ATSRTRRPRASWRQPVAPPAPSSPWWRPSSSARPRIRSQRESRRRAARASFLRSSRLRGRRLLRGFPAAGAGGGRGQGRRCRRTNVEADLLGGRVELGIEAAERLAHLGRPAVEDAELDGLLPSALVCLEALLFDGDDERVDLLLVRFFVGVGEIRGRR